jgi:hypothetical protein
MSPSTYIIFTFFETVSCYAAQAGLELSILLPQHPQWWVTAMSFKSEAPSHYSICNRAVVGCSQDGCGFVRTWWEKGLTAPVTWVVRGGA